MAFDENLAQNIKDAPLILPDEVTIAQPSGKLTVGWRQSLEALFNWLKKVVVDLTTKVTEVSDAAGETSSTVTEVIQALADGSGAYGGYLLDIDTKAGNAEAKANELIVATSGSGGAYGAHIQQVTARTNGIPANGEIKLEAMAAPTGWAAAYQTRLTAGNAAGAFGLLADGAGGSAFFVNANRFMMTDPAYNGGQPGNVFQYSLGKFIFNVPVEIRTQDIGANAVSTQSTGSIAAGELDLDVYLRAGSAVIVFADFIGSEIAEPTAAYLGINGGLIATKPITTIKFMENGDSGSVVATVQPTQIIAPYLPSYTGIHTFSLYTTGAGGLIDQTPKQLLIQELAR